MPKMRFWNGTVWVALDAQDADTVDGKHASDFAPANHVGAGASAHALATPTIAGFISGPNQDKLDKIAAGAQVNQSAFSNVKIGADIIAADNVTDTLEFVAGSNITLTPDITNDRIIISSAGSSATGEMNQNAFSSVKIGGTQLDADNTMDILNLVAGTNISLTPDSATDTITIGLTGKLGDADTLDGQHASAFATAVQVADLIKQNDRYEVFSSVKDTLGVFTVVDYKRLDNTLYMKSTLSTPDANGNYTRVTWQVYNDTGLSIVETVIWTLAYDANGGLISKVV
jgi:hypothetical protein